MQGVGFSSWGKDSLQIYEGREKKVSGWEKLCITFFLDARSWMRDNGIREARLWLAVLA